MANDALLVRGDALALPLADDSIDLVVTSPPYFALRSYQDGGEHCDGQIGSEASPQEFLEALWAATAEMVRVVKPSGSIFVNLGDKYAAGHGGSSTERGGVTIRKRSSFAPTPKERPDLPNPPASWGKRDATGRNVVPGFRPKSLMGMPWRYAIGCIDDLGLILRSEIVWSKPNGLPESVTDRVRRSHEQWFHFTLEPRYFSAIDEIREKHQTYTTDAGTVRYRRKGESEGDGAAGTGAAFSGDAITGRQTAAGEFIRGNDPRGKLPGSVWSIPSEPLQVPDHLGVDHFAAFPQEWPRRLILGWCPQEVCSECGEGRAPVVEKELELDHHSTHAKTHRGAVGDNGVRTARGSASDNVSRTVATITGYACACPDNSAPSTPGVVLDPFVGTGTVPMVARALGRHGVGIDMSSDYLRLASWRVFDSGHAAKSVERMNRERQEVLL